MTRPCILWLIMAAGAVAHGPLHEQIATATAQVRREPQNARLYFKRAELHRHHGDFQAARADYEKALALDESLAETELGLGRILLAEEQPEKALEALHRYVALRPEDGEGLAARAEALEKTRNFALAARDLDRAIRIADKPAVELYLAAARAWREAGEPQIALASLKEASDRFGPLVTVDLAGIELERRLALFDDALSRIDRILSQAPRKETWLVRKAEILREAGREQQAREALQHALRAIEALPVHLRNTRSMLELEKQARGAL